MLREDVPNLAPRTPPYSLEAEHGVLGSLLQDNAALAVVGDLLDARSFYLQTHQWIYAAITGLLAERMPADPITVLARLDAAGQAEACDGLPYLLQLEQAVPSARNARRYAEIVADRYAERALIAAADEVATLAWRGDMPLTDRLEASAAIMARVEAVRKSPGRRVPVLTLKELREASRAVRWVVKHVIPASSIGMLFGGSGTFKSFIALDMALHIAHGLPWMGRRTEQGAVLYIAAEGQAGVWQRIEAWHKARGLSWEGVPLTVVPQAVDLTVDAWRVVDAAQARGVHPGVVVVDTLSQTYSGEENSANEMAAYLREIGLRFRALWECAVLLIHHSGHEATERPRGSSAIRANIDFLLGAFRDEQEMIATLQCKKQKDGECFADAQFRLVAQQLGLDADNDPIGSLVAWHLSSAEQVQQAMQAEGKAGRQGNHSLLLGLVANGMEEAALRKAFMEDCGADSADAKRQAYSRARRWAIGAGFIEIAQGRVISLKVSP